MRVEGFHSEQPRFISPVVLAATCLAGLSIPFLATSVTAKTAKAKAAGSFKIDAWTFDRGNGWVFYNPELYGDYRDKYPELVDGDGKNILCISSGQVNELAPCLMDDGRVAYTRWEYVDKWFGNAQSLLMVRPDGSGSDHLYKNMVVRPGAMIHVRSIPSSRQFVTIGVGHHGGLAGPVLLVDTGRNRRDSKAMTNITPEISYPGLYPMKGKGGAGWFREPHPFSEKLSPQPGDTGPRTIHYERDVQRIRDKYCIGCHGGEDPKGELDLSDTLTAQFNVSYENIMKKHLVSFLQGGYGSANLPAEPPLTFGSHQSKLIKQIRKAPCKVDMTREEFIRIVTWIDANVPFYGTHRGKKNVKWKDEPDFLPMPLAGK